MRRWEITFHGSLPQGSTLLYFELVQNARSLPRFSTNEKGGHGFGMRSRPGVTGPVVAIGRTPRQRLAEAAWVCWSEMSPDSRWETYCSRTSSPSQPPRGRVFHLIDRQEFRLIGWRQRGEFPGCWLDAKTQFARRCPGLAPLEESDHGLFSPLGRWLLQAWRFWSPPRCSWCWPTIRRPHRRKIDETIRNDRAKFLVRAEVDHANGDYREGESLSIRVSTEEDAYLYVQYQQADGKVFQIFPNVAQSNNKVLARQAVDIPAKDDFFRWQVGSPYGKGSGRDAPKQPIKSDLVPVDKVSILCQGHFNSKEST